MPSYEVLAVVRTHEEATRAEAFARRASTPSDLRVHANPVGIGIHVQYPTAEEAQALIDLIQREIPEADVVASEIA